MSLARKKQQEILARLAQQREAAEATAAQAAEKAAKAPRKATIAPPEEQRVGPVSGRHSTATKFRARQAARLLAEAANDNAVEPGDTEMAGPYGQMLLQLTEDKRRLKALQSTEKKIELKRELVPAYADWIDGVLKASREAGSAMQDEVLMTLLVWRIDIGDFSGALEIADHALHFGLNLPPHFDRTLACLVAEEIAEAALAAPADAPLPSGVLDLTFNLVDGRDMPDQVQAKLCRAMGNELRRLADNPAQGHDVAGWRPQHLALALTFYQRALKLNAKAGCKKEVEVLERELKKETENAGS